MSRCRDLSHGSSVTAPTWARSVAPIAEWVAQALWNSAGKSASKGLTVATRLTQRHRSEGRGNTFHMGTNPIPRIEKVCEVCGAERVKNDYCSSCAVEASRETMSQVALLGHIEPKSKKAKARMSMALSLITTTAALKCVRRTAKS